jgi:hypothetical protein
MFCGRAFNLIASATRATPRQLDRIELAPIPAFSITPAMRFCLSTAEVDAPWP